jgi:hypothetical protein
LKRNYIWGYATKQKTKKTVTSRQGNNEEQAHTRNKGTNKHDWKKTAISLETSINT